MDIAGHLLLDNCKIYQQHLLGSFDYYTKYEHSFFFNKIQCTFWLNRAFSSISVLLQDIMFAHDCRSTCKFNKEISFTKQNKQYHSLLGHSSSCVVRCYEISQWFPMNYRVSQFEFVSNKNNLIRSESYENYALAFHEIVWLCFVRESSINWSVDSTKILFYQPKHWWDKAYSIPQQTILGG